MNKKQALPTKIDDLTVDQLEEAFGDNISAVADYVRAFIPPFRQKPVKPKLDKEYNSADLKKHTTEIEQWEEDMIEYGGYDALRNIESGKATDLIEKYTHENLQFEQNVPEIYRQKVISRAYSEGHSEGAYGYYHSLRNLIDIFKAD